MNVLSHHYLEGQGDLVSILMTPISHIVTPSITFINLPPTLQVNPLMTMILTLPKPPPTSLLPSGHNEDCVVVPGHLAFASLGMVLGYPRAGAHGSTETTVKEYYQSILGRH